MKNIATIFFYEMDQLECVSHNSCYILYMKFICKHKTYDRTEGASFSFYYNFILKLPPKNSTKKMNK